MKLEKVKVVVCGTTFGQVYIQGIKKYCGKKFQLVGILAKGSKRSIQCAKENNISLFNNVEQLNKENVDLVCVVVRSGIVGGNGDKISIQLLNKGISVLQEQPVSYKEAALCMKLALKNKCIYMINSFYVYTNRIRNYIKYAHFIQSESKIICIEASCSVHVLFPMIEILEKVFGSFSSWKFSALLDSEYCHPMTILHGKIADSPILLKIQNQIDPQEEDNSALLLQRISIEFIAGTLLLTDTDGLILWKPRRFVKRNQDNSLNLYGKNNDQEYLTLQKLDGNTNMTYLNEYQKLWPESILFALNEIQSLRECDYKYSTKAQYQLRLCEEWEKFAKLIGNSKIINVEKPKKIIF